MPSTRQENIFEPLCPFCREKVKFGAQICPHCRSTLAGNVQFQASQKAHGQLILLFFALLFLGIVVVVIMFNSSH